MTDKVFIFNKADHLAQVLEPNIDSSIIEALKSGQAAMLGSNLESVPKIRLSYQHQEETKKVEFLVGASQELGDSMFRGQSILILEEFLPDDLPQLYDSVFLDTKDGVETEEAEVALRFILSDSPEPAL